MTGYWYSPCVSSAAEGPENPVISSVPALEPELTTSVRHSKAVSILSKVRAKGEETMDSRVRSRNPFGIPSHFSAFSTTKGLQNPVLLYRSRRGSSAGKAFIAESQIGSDSALKDEIKVLVSTASPRGDEYPRAVLGAPIVALAGSVSAETYLIVDTPSTQIEAEHLVGYVSTRFFRFLVSLITTTRSISEGSFAFVPVQDLSRSWTDRQLYAKYGITDQEIAFIESMVRPMEQ